MKLFVKRNIINKLRQRNKFRREYIKQVKYWREHPDEFIEDFYEIKIYWYQKFFLRKFFKRGKLNVSFKNDQGAEGMPVRFTTG